MIRETGRVTSICGDELWVETIQQSACQSCAAQKGCGQSLIAKVTGKTTAIRVLPGTRDLSQITMNEQVVIGIPEDVVVNGSFLTYLLPLLMMVAGVVLAGSYSGSDTVVGLSAIAGLLLGGGWVRFYSYLNRNNEEFHPVLMDVEGGRDGIIVSQGCSY